MDRPDCYLIRVGEMLIMADLLGSKARIDPSVVECSRKGLSLIILEGLTLIIQEVDLLMPQTCRAGEVLSIPQ